MGFEVPGLSALCYILVKLLKGGLKLQGRIVLVAVTIISIAFSVFYAVQKHMWSPDNMLNIIGTAATMALASIGLDGVSTYKTKAEVLAEVVAQLKATFPQLSAIFDQPQATEAIGNVIANESGESPTHGDTDEGLEEPNIVQVAGLKQPISPP